MPTSASLHATHSAAVRAPALVAVSPVLVVSILMRSDSSSATSSWAWVAAGVSTSASLGRRPEDGRARCGTGSPATGRTAGCPALSPDRVSDPSPGLRNCRFPEYDDRDDA